VAPLLVSLVPSAGEGVSTRLWSEYQYGTTTTTTTILPLHLRSPSGFPISSSRGILVSTKLAIGSRNIPGVGSFRPQQSFSPLFFSPDDGREVAADIIVFKSSQLTSEL